MFSPRHEKIKTREITVIKAFDKLLKIVEVGKRIQYFLVRPFVRQCLRLNVRRGKAAYNV